MIIAEVPEVNLTHISIAQKTLNGVGICFFDPVTETLFEFNSNTKIPIYPMEESYRRFFIVRDGINITFNTVTIQTIVENSSYVSKLLFDKVQDINTVPENNTIIEFFSNFPNGIIPFYLYIKSNSSSYLDVDLKLILEVN